MMSNTMGKIRLFLLVASALQLSACELVSKGAKERGHETREQRIQKVADWVKAGHDRQGHKIVRTDRLDDGTVVDWVDRATVKGADVEPPPALVEVAPPQGLEGVNKGYCQGGCSEG